MKFFLSPVKSIMFIGEDYFILETNKGFHLNLETGGFTYSNINSFLKRFCDYNFSLVLHYRNFKNKKMYWKTGKHWDLVLCLVSFLFLWAFRYKFLRSDHSSVILSK